MRELKIFIGCGLNEVDLKTILGRESGKRLKDVAHALLNHKDDGAQIHSITVQTVTIDEDSPTQVRVEFETSWSVYKGCEDRNLAGIESEEETAIYTPDGYLIFMLPVARRPANPC